MNPDTNPDVMELRTYNARAELDSLRDHYERLIRAVEVMFGLRKGQLRSTGRRGPISIARARAHACRLLRADGLSFPAVGRVLGLDHSTVIHYVNGRGRDRHRSVG